MNRKGLILILLFLSWVLYNVHRVWNNAPVVETHPFPLDPEYGVTWHWYIYMLLKDISYLVIFLALWLYMHSSLKRDRQVLSAFGAIFVVQLTEIPHYLLIARHSEGVLLLQGIYLIGIALKILFKK